MLRTSAALAALAIVAVASVTALDNGVGRTPPMGWNSWNRFQCNVNETLLRSTIDAIVSTGLRDAGYVYVNVDDCWASSRDLHGTVVPDPNAFPSGMKALADYAHSKGLKFGVYSDSGVSTCAGRPGSLGYEKQDAASYAEWGVDYLKYDNCWTPADDHPLGRYAAMRDALNATGRHIFFSMCEWGVASPWRWAGSVGNAWRTTGDISDYWESMLRCLDDTIGLSQYAGPGAWNDPDMLEVGNGGMSLSEYRAHFALWALLKAPLLIGTDVSNMSKGTADILMAKEVIAVNQDPLGVAGDLIQQEGPEQVYAAPLADGSRAVVFFNRHVTDASPPYNMSIEFTKLGLPAGSRAAVRDLYARQDVGTFTGRFTVAVPPHDVFVARITPLEGRLEELVAWRPWH